jgi:HEAT repeat protein
VSRLLAAADDPDEDVRRAAIEQLPVVEDARALPRLTRAVTAETPRNRAAAAHALRAVDDPATVWPLRQALTDPDPWVRYFAADSVARRRVLEAVPSLVEASAADPAPQVRIAALRALGTLDVPDVVDVAAEQIRSADADLAAAAIAALAGSSDPRVDALLEDAVRSPNVASRAPAVHALASRCSRAAVDALAWAARLEDPPELRRLAVEGLARLASAADTGRDSESCLDAQASAAAALLDLASERSLREDALAALTTLPPEAIAPIASALASARPAVRLAAVEALGRLRHPAASEALARALEDEEPSVRGLAIAVFGRLGTTTVGQAVLRMAASDPDEGVRLRAAALCRRHGWGGDA